MWRRGLVRFFAKGDQVRPERNQAGYVGVAAQQRATTRAAQGGTSANALQSNALSKLHKDRHKRLAHATRGRLSAGALDSCDRFARLSKIPLQPISSSLTHLGTLGNGQLSVIPRYR
jgi:hypothetical protein